MISECFINRTARREHQRVSKYPDGPHQLVAGRLWRVRAWEIETHDSVVGLAEDFGREAAENF